MPWEAFAELHAGRDYGFAGPLPLKSSEIACYAFAHEYEGGLDELTFFMRRMDGAYLEHVEKLREARDKTKKRKG